MKTISFVAGGILSELSRARSLVSSHHRASFMILYFFNAKTYASVNRSDAVARQWRNLKLLKAI